VLNMWTADKEWSSSLAVERGANNSSLHKTIMLEDFSQRLGLIPILSNELCNGKWA
jgi:hypothetical protein